VSDLRLDGAGPDNYFNAHSIPALKREFGTLAREELSMSPKAMKVQKEAKKSLQRLSVIDNRLQERLRPCSGRDEMCLEVLNDDWASHPTWASEDSGFVAHRKNVFEESLHRIEEERHDYDFNIEANAKVIQLLEPIGQQILATAPEARKDFRMPIGLGGQSQAIYKRVLKKVYGEKGPEVVADLFKDPCAVLPIVLARLKQKDEEWRFTQVSFSPFLEPQSSLTWITARVGESLACTDAGYVPQES
jgi:histone deacetylase complex regulatory component SIN3